MMRQAATAMPWMSWHRPLVRDAAVGGEPEAAAQMATLTALGLYFKHNWQHALCWLVIAAERHWAPARDQRERAQSN
jgi:hypothetical protein